MATELKKKILNRLKSNFYGIYKEGESSGIRNYLSFHSQLIVSKNYNLIKEFNQLRAKSFKTNYKVGCVDINKTRTYRYKKIDEELIQWYIENIDERFEELLSYFEVK